MASPSLVAGDRLFEKFAAQKRKFILRRLASAAVAADHTY
jgi:hypothetical protein